MDENENYNLSDVDAILNSIPQGLVTNTDINADEILKETEDLIYGKTDNSISNNNLDFLQTNEEQLKEINKINLTDLDNLNNILNAKPENLEEKKEEEEKKNSKIIECKNPIDFINYMETEYIKSKIEKNDKIFQLQIYKNQTTQKKLEVIQFLPKTTLSSRFFKDGNVITSITSKEDIIFTGNNIGKIKMYSCEKGFEYKSLINSEIQNSNDKKVICMDVSDKLSFLISGYSNGFISLWDLSNGKCKKLLKEEHNGKCILAIKFLHVENGIWEFLSSDINGFVNRITLSDTFFFTLSIDVVTILQYKLPFFLIDVLKFSNEEKKKYPFIVANNCEIVALGCTQYVLIYQIEPDLKKLYEFKKPSYLKKCFIPDVAFGLGYIPRNVPSDILKLYENNNNEIDPNPIASENDIEINKIYRLVSISWEKIIYIYVMKFDNKGPQELILVGHYINNNNILRMGFLSNSIIYIFDMYKKLKVINSGLLTPGKLKYNENSIPIAQLNVNHKPELEEEITLDQNILFQSIIPDTTDKDHKMLLPTYNNLIITQMKTLYLLSSKSFYYGKLLNWEQCLNNLQQKGEWMDILVLGLDIFNGQNITLADIPIDEKERKVRVSYILKASILQYVVMSTNSAINDNISDYDNINKCMIICIEFCIEINELDYLLNQIQPIFTNRGFGKNFIENLEPFILFGKLKNKNLDFQTVNTIVQLYIENKRFHILSQILINLDINSIDHVEIINKCIEYTLITPLIYIYMNNKEENYFEGILKIYDMYKKAKLIEEDKFISYEECLEKIPIFELENSKQYIGHKLLWYINLCIEGKKFITEQLIEKEKYDYIIQRIFLWVLKKEILDELLKFDSLSFFEILTQLFIKENSLNTIKLIEYDKKLFEGIIYKEKEVDHASLLLTIDIIIDRAKEINNILVLNDLYEFISNISIKLEKLSNEIIMETSKYILSSESRIEELKNSKDNFGFRKKDLNKEEIKRLSSILNDMINNKKNLKKNELEELLESTENTSFIIVKINLLELLERYIICLDTFLNEYNDTDKIEITFNFINEVLKKLKKENFQKYKEFKMEIYKRFINLAKLDIDKFLDIIEKFFDNNHIKVIEKLKEEKTIELNYIERVLLNYKDNNLPTEDEEILIYNSLLLRHIDLLCECGRKNEILKNLKERASYPDECLDKCIENNVNDAAIFLYLRQDNIKEALDLSNKELSNDYEELIKCFKDNNLQILNNLTIKHDSNLDRSIFICENAHSEEQENENMWFGLVKLCYEYRNKVKKINIDNIKEINLKNLDKIIIDDIQKVFEKMYIYVGIKKIVEYVTINNKEVEFKEFKPILMQMLEGYTNFSKIFELVRNLISIRVNGELKLFYHLTAEGTFYQVKYCDECENKFEENNIVILFKCGHKLHLMCCIMDNNIFSCPICRKKDIESSITTYRDINHKVKKVTEKDVKKFMRDFENNNNNLDNNNISNNRENKLTYELKTIDKFLYDTLSIFD